MSTTPRTIDVHAHHTPADCVALLPGGLPLAHIVGDMSDQTRRLADMDRAGVDVQVLSPFLGFLSRDLSIARQHNDAMAAAVDAHPERFIGLAAAPMAEPEAAPDEIERAIKDLGLHGVEMGTNVLGKNLDDPAFAPVFDRLAALDVPVFLHPLNVLGPDRLASYSLDNLIGNVTDTAVAAASLIFGGVMERLPNLKVYLAHGGGSCPFVRGRWDHGWRARANESRIKQPPSAYLARLYFDALTHSPDALAFLVAWAGADHVMMGTDYPFDMGDASPVETIEANAALSVEQKRAILGESAASLFGL
jgi:aminocarboxymuconate-semialdehyde decarboxylase